MNNTIHLIEQNFQSQHSGKCDLLIQINTNYIFSAIVDKGQDQLKVLCQTDISSENNNLSLIEKINQLLETESFLKYHFRKVKISIETFNFTFIPSDLYVDLSLPDYSKFIQPFSEADILVNNIKTPRIKNVTAVPTDLQNKLKSFFYKPDIYSQADPFIEGALKIHNPSVNSQLFLNINSDTFEAVFLHNFKLIFYNIFALSNADEFNYFLLNMIQQLGINKDTTLVTFAGNIIENDEVYIRVQKYFSRITFADSKLLIYQSDLFTSIPSHLFFSLISFNLCD